nr:Arm DNA-binding domain-containing protein [Psychrobacillus glaciei]
MKLQKSNKDPELYSYLTANNEKLWMYRHKYIDKNGKRREKKKSSFISEKTALRALLEIKAA